MTFRDRLAVSYAALFLLMFAALGLGVYVSLDRALRDQVDEGLRAIASYHNAVWPQSYPAVSDGQKLGPCVFYMDLGGRVLFRTVNTAPPIAFGQEAFESALHGGGEVLTRASTPMGPMRVLVTRIHGENGASHMLEVGTPLEPVEHALRTLLLVLVGLGALALVAALIAGRWLAGQAISPVEAVTAAARAIHARDLTTRLPVPERRDEIGELVAVFNQMLARLDSAFEAQRRFTADASHELRSPLTALRGEIEVARRRPRQPDEYRAVLASALEEIDRLEQLLTDLLELAKLDDDRATAVPIDLGALCEGLVARYRPEAAERGLGLFVHATPGVQTAGVATRLERVIGNLVSNALRYTPTGRIDVTVRTEGGEALVTVADTGLGIPSDEQGRIFDRFHRLDASRARVAGGVGLGLAIARQIARAHGGDLTVASGPGGGATFTVRLPRLGGYGLAGLPPTPSAVTGGW